MGTANVRPNPVTVVDMLHAAQGLIEPGENPEYARGACELIAELFPVHGMLTTDRAAQIARVLNLGMDLYKAQPGKLKCSHDGCDRRFSHPLPMAKHMASHRRKDRRKRKR